MPGETTNDDILTGVNQIIQAINDLASEAGPTVNNITIHVTGGGSGCGCGPPTSGPGGVIDVPPADDEPTDTGGPPPEGFDSWAEYRAYKCKAANLLFDVTLAFMQFMASLPGGAASSLTIVTLGPWLLAQIGAGLAAATAAEGGLLLTSASAGIFAVSWLATAPGWMIAAFVAAVVGLAAAAGIGVFTVFSWLADDFETKREQVVCDLYNSTTVAEANSVLSTAYGDSVGSFVISSPYNAFEATIRAALAGVASYFFLNSFVNQLFVKSSTVDSYEGATIDCDTCTECAFEFVIPNDGSDFLVTLPVGTYILTPNGEPAIYFATTPLHTAQVRMNEDGTGDETRIAWGEVETSEGVWTFGEDLDTDSTKFSAISTAFLIGHFYSCTIVVTTEFTAAFRINDTAYIDNEGNFNMCIVQTA